MKIAFFADVFHPELSGIAESILLTGSELLRRGHDLDFYVPRYGEREYSLSSVIDKEPYIPGNGEIIRLPSKSFPGPTTVGRMVFPDLIHGYKTDKKYDIIHTHTFFGAGLDALILAKRQKTVLVGTNHTYIESFVDYSPLKTKWLKKIAVNYVRWYYDKCRIVSTPSSFLTNHMKKIGSRTELFSISNPIAPELFKKASEVASVRAKYGLSSFTVLYSGRLAPEKNVITLMKAFVPFVKKVKGASLVFVGLGDEKDKILATAKGEGLLDKVLVLGPYIGAERHKLFDLYRAADVFAFPSTSDTQSMVTIEAFAAYTPAIVAEVGPLPDLVREGRGITFPPENIKKLTEALLYVYENPKELRKMGEKAREYADNFTVEKVADEWERRYNSLI
ncbi:MAG: hypothetical protein COV07_02185 [Candidatus Vogelbacteria bacterium CG10_big_fil_rev_8_21_14_0_10_45_14]|uniref:Glycosyl transferase family 1 n=1 Tax=Candidatus Vogelbacteria bacterium CG10_big_fil_rev_8_21_14_0_10_45_14 TaxID=1975042 RepID=A0A2H0RJW3_9BACT|nr:MAG: hypothetical protein COV07_02185 [Candidatus Vogelbacteria bacterium CG10_big_fil_rev_8_21_14_0_10_45_14]